MDDLDALPYGSEEIMELLRQCATRLMEHLDSIQIIATRKLQDGMTQKHAFGMGNWYARFGSVAEWMVETENLMTEPQGDDDDC